MRARTTSDHRKGTTLRSTFGLSPPIAKRNCASHRAAKRCARPASQPPRVSHTVERAQEQARRQTMLVHRQKNKSSPKMISKPKLITALALLGLHGAVGDDLCAPASTSAARRVYAVARPRRAPRIVFLTLGHRRPRRRPRPRRRRPRRPCRAGALRREIQRAFKTRDIAN